MGNNGGSPWRGIILFSAALLLIAGALFFRGPYNNPNQKTPAETIQMIQNGEIVVTQDHPLEIEISDHKDIQCLSGYYKNRTTNGEARFRTAISSDWNKDVLDAVSKAGLHPVPISRNNPLASALIGFLPIGIFLLVLYFFFRMYRFFIRRR